MMSIAPVAIPPGLLAAAQAPSLVWAIPFALLLLAVAILPAVPRVGHWWHHNSSKLIVGLALGAVVLIYYALRDHGAAPHSDVVKSALKALGATLTLDHGHLVTSPGLPAAGAVMGNALMEFIPFFVLLFSLYTISGGISIRGDLPAHPSTNTAILAIGAILANLVGTTGAAMLLVRFLLSTNKERRHKVHTLVFFIFIVCNCAGCLLPIADPPLFLGYLRGVPFLWTLHLLPMWAFTTGALLAIYFVWDTLLHKRETVTDLRRDERTIEPLRIRGSINFIFLAAVVLAVATLDATKPFPGTAWTPPPFLREFIQLAMVGLSYAFTPRGLRRDNAFNFHAINEVGALFIGIFITVQVPLEILALRGGELGLAHPWQFFWATGALSAFLDNAPTYLVFFQVAESLAGADPVSAQAGATLALPGGSMIAQDLLTAVSIGAVFFGAFTYIGNGPNFLVRAIAEHSGVKMPGFFGFMLYSAAVLLPLMIVVTLVFLR